MRDPATLAIDCAAESARIEAFIRRTVGRELSKRGVVLGVSGGVDSALCAALAARALGPRRVFALSLPERDSDPAGTARAGRLIRQLGVDSHVEDIAPVLEQAGCYRRRDEAVQRLFPDHRPGGRFKIALAGGLADLERLNYFNLIVELPDGSVQTRRMPADVYLQVVAATNMKQRVRKMIEYYHAERLNYAVLGTPNKLEYELGFFVRGGDGLADLKPIAHLYKTQVYALAEYLGVPEEIRNQPPSTDTYALPQTQEEFYFTLPAHIIDALLLAFATRKPYTIPETLSLSAAQANRLLRDVERKRRLAARLHSAAHRLADDDVLAEPRPARYSNGRLLHDDSL